MTDAPVLTPESVLQDVDKLDKALAAEHVDRVFDGPSTHIGLIGSLLGINHRGEMKNGDKLYQKLERRIDEARRDVAEGKLAEAEKIVTKTRGEDLPSDWIYEGANAPAHDKTPEEIFRDNQKNIGNAVENVQSRRGFDMQQAIFRDDSREIGEKFYAGFQKDMRDAQEAIDRGDFRTAFRIQNVTAYNLYRLTGEKAEISRFGDQPAVVPVLSVEPQTKAQIVQGNLDALSGALAKNDSIVLRGDIERNNRMFSGATFGYPGTAQQAVLQTDKDLADATGGIQKKIDQGNLDGAQSAMSSLLKNFRDDDPQKPRLQDPDAVSSASTAAPAAAEPLALAVPTMSSSFTSSLRHAGLNGLKAAGAASAVPSSVAPETASVLAENTAPKVESAAATVTSKQRTPVLGMMA